MGEGKNVGIGKALNAALKYGLENDFDYLLTMDQDSSFTENSCKQYFNSIFDYNSTAFFSVNYILNGKQLYADEPVLKRIDLSMTSGSVYPIQAFKKLDFFVKIFLLMELIPKFVFGQCTIKFRF